MQETSVRAVRAATVISVTGLSAWKCSESHMYSSVPSAQSSTPSQRRECGIISSLAQTKWVSVQEPVALWQEEAFLATASSAEAETMTVLRRRTARRAKTEATRTFIL